jgi:hypothetical protein
VKLNFSTVMMADKLLEAKPMQGGKASLHKGIACCRPILYLILSDPVKFRSRNLRILSLIQVLQILSVA